MRAIVFCGLFGIVSMFFHGTLPISFLPANLLVLLVICISQQSVSVGGAIICFVLGLLMDWSLGKYTGLYAASCVASYAVASSLSLRFYSVNPISLIITALAAVLCAEITQLSLLAIHSELPMSSKVLIGVSLRSLATVLLAPVIIPFFQRLISSSQVHSEKANRASW